MTNWTRSPLVRISVSMPQIFFPPTRTSLGHLSLTRPGQYCATTSATATPVISGMSDEDTAGISGRRSTER